MGFIILLAALVYLESSIFDIDNLTLTVIEQWHKNFKHAAEHR